MFRVEWLQEALNELTRIWMQADPARREAITAATHALDQDLQVDPDRQGESRGDRERVVFAYPLGVQVEIDLQRRIVWVLHTWRIRRRGE